MKRPDIRVSPSFFIYIALFIILLPIKWLTAWLFATFVHEFLHYIAIRLCRAHVRSVYISAASLSIETDFDSNLKECFCAAAGPIGSFFVLCCIHRFPLFGFWGLVQLTYNLIPIYPSDGSRVFRCAAKYILPNKYYGPFTEITEQLCILAIIASAICISIRFKAGIISFVIVTIFFLRQRKIPCKRWYKRVQ